MNSNSLKMARTERGMSKVELARRSGLSRVTVSNIEDGNTNPTLATIKAICKALGENPNDIFFHDVVHHEEQ